MPISLRISLIAISSDVYKFTRKSIISPTWNKWTKIATYREGVRLIFQLFKMYTFQAVNNQIATHIIYTHTSEG